MKIDIPIPCPYCGGKMYSTGYDTQIKILKQRTWHICKECNFTQDTDIFKRRLLSV